MINAVPIGNASVPSRPQGRPRASTRTVIADALAWAGADAENDATLPKTKPYGAAASTSNVIYTTSAETSAEANAKTSAMEPATAAATRSGDQQDSSNNDQPAYNQPSQPSQPSQFSLVPSTTSLHQSEQQQSNRAHDAVVDSEASPQPSSNQNKEHCVIVGIVDFIPEVELKVGWQTTTWRKRPHMFGTHSTFDAACAVASRVAGRTIVPGGPKQHVRDRHITLFIVHAVSALVGARLGVGGNLMHIRYATDKVQDVRLTPSFENSIEVTNFGSCSHGSNPGAELYVLEPGFNPASTPLSPPPDSFALDDVIGDETTLGAAACPPDPAQDSLVLAPIGPMTIVYIVVLTVSVPPHMTHGYTTIHGQYFDADLATGAAGLATQSISIRRPGEDGHFPEEAHSHTAWLADDNTEVSILMAPLWYVQTHGIPLNWQRPRLLICTGGERTTILTVPMSP